jgi:hypothetical protein
MEDLEFIRRLNGDDISGLEFSLACYQTSALRTAFKISGCTIRMDSENSPIGEAKLP